MELDTANENDEVVMRDNTAVLLIGPGLPDGLLGKKLDVAETTEGAQIVISD